MDIYISVYYIISMQSSSYYMKNYGMLHLVSEQFFLRM